MQCACTTLVVGRKVKMKNKKDKFPVAIIVALLCYCFGVQAVMINTVGLFFVPASTALGVPRGTFSTYYSIQALVTMVMLFFAGKILQKYQSKIKLILLGASALLFIGYALFAIGTAVWYWYVGAVFVGIGVAFTTQMFIGTLVNNWFKVKAGTVMGILMALTSVFGVFISPFFTAMIASKGYQFVYWIINFTMVVTTVIPAIFLVKFKPADAGRKAYGEDKATEMTKGQTANAQSEQSVTSVSYGAALKSSAFWFLSIFTFSAVCWSTFIQIIPGYAASVGFTGLMIGTAMSAMLIGGIAGKLALGYLTDKAGPVKATGIMVVLGVIGILIMIMNDSTNQGMFFTGAFLFGLAFGILGVVPPIIIREAFGMKNYAAIYGNITIAIWVGVALTVPFYNFVYDKTGSYITPMYISAVVLVIGFLCMIAGRNSAKKLPREE
jgi:MFS family permease